MLAGAGGGTRAAPSGRPAARRAPAAGRGRAARRPGPAPGTRAPGTRAAGVRAAGIRALGIAVAGAVLFALALGQSRTVAASSDGAANVLQARAMTHGNPLLRGWWTSDVSFYTTELPEYALVTAFAGVTPEVVHYCGALGYALTVVLAALAGRGAPRPGGAAGRAGLAGAAIAGGVLLAPSVAGGTQVFLENPDHAGTAVPVLAALLVIDRIGARPRALPALAAAAAALLALAQLGDELAVAAAAVPVAVVSAVRLLGRAGAAPGGGAAGGARADWLLLGAAAASAAAAAAAGRALAAAGGFTRRPIPGGLLAPPGQVPWHARVLGESLALIFGANQPGTPERPVTRTWHAALVAMADLHLVGMLLAAAGLAAGLAALASRRADRVTQVLAVGAVAVLAFGLLGPLLRSLSAAHEMAILAPFGAVLAGRTLPPLLSGLARSARLPRPAAARAGRRPARPAGVRLAALSLGGWLAIGTAELGFGALWPPAPPPGRALAGWLIAHRERAGLAGYWQADITTVAAGGRVLVAPITVRAGPSGRLEPRRWESSASWYRPGLHRATFVIAVTGPAAARGGLSPATALARFGPPAWRHRIGAAVIMGYRHNLLTRLGPPGSPAAAAHRAAR